MENRRDTTWWQFGLIGGIALSLATLYKFVHALPRLFQQPFPWSALVAAPVAAFLLGFACGCVVWCLRSISSRFGLAGDAIIGVVVVNVYFLLVAVLVDRNLLRLWVERESAAVILGVAAVVGAGGGLLWGLQQRRE